MSTFESSMAMKLVVIPVGIMLLGYVLSALFRRWSVVSALLLAMGACGSLTAADWLLRGQADWWPTDVTRRLHYFAWLAVLVVPLETLWRSSRAAWKHFLLIICRVAVSTALAWQLTSVAEPRWMWVSAITSLLTLVWTLLSLPLCIGWLSLGTWAAIAGMTGALLTLSGSASLGLVSVAFGASLGILALLHIKWSISTWQAVAGVFAVALMGLLVSGQQFAELPLSSGVLLLVSSLTVLVMLLPVVGRRRWINSVMVMALALGMGGLSWWLTRVNTPAEDKQETDNPYLKYYQR